MARTAIVLNQISRTGVVSAEPPGTAGDVANGHTIPNDGNMFLEVKNSNSGSTAHIITFNVVELVDGQTPAPRTVSVAAGVTMKFGPWPVSEYGSALLVEVAHAELLLAAYHLS